MQVLAAWLRLCMTPGVGNVSARKLLATFGLPQGIFDASEAALSHCVSAAQAKALHILPPGFEAQWAQTCAWLEGAEPGVPQAARRIVTLADTDYPAALLHTEDPPLMLYLLGTGRLGEAPGDFDPMRSIAMVGSRNPTAQGALNARAFAQAFAAIGLSVVSGMALGVDAACHEGALELAQEPEGAARSNLTLAVVGTGLDRVYPARHRALAHRIAAHGLLMSEYPLGTPPLADNFPRRNRLISALSKGTLVVEAALKSGSLITARLASEQGKEVFAIPGSIHAVQSRGCHALIKQGAKLVESAEDVIEELQWGATTARPASAAQTSLPLEGNQALLDAIGHDPVTLDSLQARTGLDTANLQAQLLMLEVEGRLARLPGGLFQQMARS